MHLKSHEMRVEMGKQGNHGLATFWNVPSPQLWSMSKQSSVSVTAIHSSPRYLQIRATPATRNHWWAQPQSRWSKNRSPGGRLGPSI